ncbi:hypothetical protein CJS38_19085 [Salmonella enterica subsp. enterica serovar Schwarzengrund]|nr:hypothetical protein SEECH997_007060 [Salmonella enterica subsp. enterica serovar Chester str. ATCC 11997]OWR25450.1 hypothetical protein CDO01_04335 [Salmonella enterica subsp. enterica serovar Schwarzengrund]PEH29565.1 hypothetical protein CBI75_10310 [Salmonella enterica]SUG87519.1 putative inner membrane protein [Salmonella enterica subsp. enterica]PAO96786.1 hypothetical protein CJS39_12020 [Salmonella enterica subsp. enterica serovar Schwarzengrund]
MGLALTGRRTRRSNLLPADLSLTPVTSLSMLLGTHSLAAFKQLELFWVYTMSALLFPGKANRLLRVRKLQRVLIM